MDYYTYRKFLDRYPGRPYGYYDRCGYYDCGYRRPYYPPYYPPYYAPYGGIYGSQIGYNNQSIYNAGWMAGVNQISNINNIGRPY